jgi:hypothetical protein
MNYTRLSQLVKALGTTFNPSSSFRVAACMQLLRKPLPGQEASIVLMDATPVKMCEPGGTALVMGESAPIVNQVALGRRWPTDALLRDRPGLAICYNMSRQSKGNVC